MNYKVIIFVKDPQIKSVTAAVSSRKRNNLRETQPDTTRENINNSVTQSHICVCYIQCFFLYVKTQVCSACVCVCVFVNIEPQSGIC